MNKTKILYFTLEQDNYVDKSKQHLKNAIKARPDVECYFYQGAGEITDILSRVPFQPDFIYNDDFMKNRFAFGELKGLNKVKIPSGIMFNDIRKMADQFEGYVRYNNIDLTFATFRDRFLSVYPGLKDRFRWLPICVDTNFFQDNKLQRENNFLMLGDMTRRVYPVRNKILKSMYNEPNFVYFRHPGYRNFSEDEHKKLIIGENYVRELNKAKIFLTCGSKYNYVLGKYYEVLACNTLLMATGSQEHRDLGFIDRETFVEINKNNFLGKAQYYLQNEEERLAIAQRGYEMVRERHTVEKRAEQFVNYIKEYLASRNG